ncbi:uncharacterized protein LOC142333383 [Lycorma delicatula]|uniref:uncharacterized protein LOC142333383 n=1 Tax=Lycorma delicatula TaxID=130591 RepID=UPI003F50FCFD
MVLCYTVLTVIASHNPLEKVSDITNDFSVCILQIITTPRTNVAFSPYGLVSVLVLIHDGADISSSSAIQIAQALRLSRHKELTQLGFRDLHRYLKSYFTSDGFLRGLVLSNPKAILLPNYLRTLKYYGFEPDVSIETTTLSNITQNNVTTVRPVTTTSKISTVKEENEISGRDAIEKTLCPTLDTTVTLPTRINFATEIETNSVDKVTLPIEVITTTTDDSRRLKPETEPTTTNGFEMTTNPTTVIKKSTDSLQKESTLFTEILEAASSVTSAKYTDVSEVTTEMNELVSEKSLLNNGISSKTITDIPVISIDLSERDFISPTIKSAEVTTSIVDNVKNVTVISSENSDDKISVTDETLKSDTRLPEIITTLLTTVLNDQQETTTISKSTGNNDYDVESRENNFLNNIPLTLQTEVTDAEKTTTKYDQKTTSDVIIPSVEMTIFTTAPDDKTTEKSITTDTTLPERTTETDSFTTVPLLTDLETSTIPTDTTSLTTEEISVRQLIKDNLLADDDKQTEHINLTLNTLHDGLNTIKNFPNLKNITHLSPDKSLSSEYNDNVDTNYNNYDDGNGDDDDDDDDDNDIDDVLEEKEEKEKTNILKEIESNNSTLLTTEKILTTNTNDDSYYNFTTAVSLNSSDSEAVLDDLEYAEDTVRITNTSNTFSNQISNGTDNVDKNDDDDNIDDHNDNDSEYNNYYSENYEDSYNDTTLKQRRKRKRSINDERYRISNWLQGTQYRNPSNQWFSTFDGEKLVPVLTVRAFLPYADIPSIGAQALQIPLDVDYYTMLILLPRHDVGFKQLLYSLQWCSIRGIISSLRTTPVYAVIPTFTLTHHINLVDPLMQLGIKDIFDSHRADLSEMSKDPNLFVRSIEQVVTISVRENYNNNNQHRWYDATESQIQQQFVATRPFVFFVIDSETKVSLVAGTMVDPSLSSNTGK